MASLQARLAARVRALLGPDRAGVRQSLVALGLGLVAAMTAGLVLGSISETLEELPGLLILVPAAIGLRGTVFGALGSRLGTAIHAGTYGGGARRGSMLNQNLAAAAVLTIVLSVVVAVLARAVAVGFGVTETISVPELIVISVVGGLLASVGMAGLTVALAAASARAGWDPDNVMAPLITAGGDLLTVPSLFVAAQLVDHETAVTLLTVLLVAAAAGAVIGVLRTDQTEVRDIVRQSFLVILLAGVLSLVAGVALEGRLDGLARFPALLTLVPPFLATAGSLGGILSNRLTSKLHLGLIEPTTAPGPAARGDVAQVFALALPAFVAASILAEGVAGLADLASPGLADMVGVAVLGGLLATSFAGAVAYFGAVVSYRSGIDPDNVGIPLVTSSIDLVGSLSFVLAVALVGVT